MSATSESAPWARWIIYLVATVVAAFLVEYVWGLSSASYALIMGVATGLAAAAADAVVRYG